MYQTINKTEEDILPFSPPPPHSLGTSAANSNVMHSDRDFPLPVRLGVDFMRSPWVQRAMLADTIASCFCVRGEIP
jgi:predicted DNA-binding transcriptional regulator AlpA